MKLRSPRNWSPSSRSSFRVKSLKAPASGFEVPATRRGLEGPRAGPGRRLPSGPRSMLKIGLERLRRRGARSRGRSARLTVIDGAVRRGRHQAAVGGEEVQVELFERDLRQVVEVGGDLAGRRVGMDRADQLGVDPEAVGDHEEPVLVARASVRRCRSSPSSGAGERRRVIVDGADLRRCRGSAAGSSLPKFACGVGAGALPVGGVGVDRQPFGQDDSSPARSWEGEAAKPCAWGS